MSQCKLGASSVKAGAGPPVLTHPFLIITVITGSLVQAVLTVDLCQVCACLNGFFGPPYISASCNVNSPDNLSYLHSVTKFPSEPYELELQNYVSYNQPVIVPVDAFASFTNSSPCCLGFYGFYNLAPIENGTFRGLQLQRVEFAGGGMDSLPMDALRELSTSLLRIDVYNILTADGKAMAPPRFHLFEALQEINIEATPLKVLPNYTFCSLPSLIRVKMSGGLLQDHGFSRCVFHNVPRLETLLLPNNNFREMPLALSDLRTLKVLDLSNNEITFLDGRVLRNFPKLTELRLQGNPIEMVGATAVEAFKNIPSLEVFRLGKGNPFLCTCELLPFIHWLHEASVHIDAGSEFTQYACRKPPALSGKPLLPPELAAYLESNCSKSVGTTTERARPSVSYSAPGHTTEKNDPKLVVDPFAPYKIIVPVVVVSIVLSISGIVGIVALHKKLRRRWVGIFRRFDSGFPRRRAQSDSEIEHEGPWIEPEFKFDAYVCHHECMTEFVANAMIRELEQGPERFRLCLSFRDFLLGADKLDNVAAAMEDSRVVVVLLDANFVASGQCMLELNMACSRMLEAGVGTVRPAAEALLPEGVTGLLLVLLEALPVDALPNTLRVLQDKITCLEWSTENSERCWQQLKSTLRATRARHPHEPMD